MDNSAANRKKKKEVSEARPTLWPFKNLANYKSMHAERARSMGKYEEFMASPNLTRARRIVFK